MSFAFVLFFNNVIGQKTINLDTIENTRSQKTKYIYGMKKKDIKIIFLLQDLQIMRLYWLKLLGKYFILF